MILADFAFNSVNLSDQNISNSINPKKKIRSTEKKMGIIRSSFSFITGTVCGIYIAQTYNVPNIKKLGHCAVSMAKQVEEKYRKPKSRDDV
ncbi:unnamed protein product [Arabidopsis thaliana]|uniref:(thale cress) hypothetical protein n=1 Tax=Arabidopsis thaliana TaxID=3702 RepID=A0A7G2F054_ARATH|nr:unnamed protein product [Arabidopsis thaliana]